MVTILFVQLPPPRFRFVDPPTNIPFAAGFLAEALVGKAAQRYQIDILPSEKVDVLGDQALIDVIIAEKPSILALSLYVWNVERSLFVASLVKKELPDIKVIIGGPEVTFDNKSLLYHPTPVAGVIGEGEPVIEDLISAVLGESGAPPSCFLKTSGLLQINTENHAQFELHDLGCPYVDGRIHPSVNGVIFLETVRGCPFKCKYCYYHKAFEGVRTHALNSIEKTLEFAYSDDSGVNEIYLMDPTFNSTPHFRQIVELLSRLRIGKDIKIHTELRPDFLTDDDVSRLARAGLRSAEIGLQSTNTEALKLAGRHMNLQRTARGAQLLKSAGIEVTTGIILGLPGDTPEAFQRTLEWLKSNEAYSVVHPFMLSILPGSEFRSRSTELGLEYDSRPPYHVFSTPTFPAEAFRISMEMCEDFFNMEIDSIPIPSLVDSERQLATLPGEAEYISSWIIHSLERAASNRDTVIKKITNPFTVRFKNSSDFSSVQRIVKSIAHHNPHTIFNIIFDQEPTGDLIDIISKIEQLVAQIGNPELFINKAYYPLYEHGEVVTPAIYFILNDPGTNSRRESLIEDCSVVGEIIWRPVNTSPECLAAAPLPLLVPNQWSANQGEAQSILDLLWEIHKENSNEVLFSSGYLAEKWLVEYQGKIKRYFFSEIILVN